MKPPPPPELAATFKRPAAIAIRFADETQFREAIAFYATALGLPKPAVLVTPGVQYCTFPVGSEKPIHKKDIELRLEWYPQDPPTLPSRTVIYWEIKPEKVTLVKGALQKLGYRPENKLKPVFHSFKDERFTVEDSNGDLLGGHPNPTFPPGRLSFAGKSPAAIPRRTPAKLLSGLALGTLALGAFQLLRRTRR